MELTVYDVNTDSRRPATQEDIDKLEEFIGKLSMINRPVEDTPRPKEGYKFALACYANKARTDGVFVAEKKEILPYPGITDIYGRAIYPSVPETPWTLRWQLPHDFAAEIVWRWNTVKSLQDESRKSWEELSDFI